MAEAPFPDLQTEVLAQIFHKLPIRSIIQCKLVCKKWRSLLSDPFFEPTYDASTIPNHPTHLMMIPRSSSFIQTPALRCEIDSLSNPPVSHPQPLPSDFSINNCTTILGSCGGLVAFYQSPHRIFLFNPFTGEEKPINLVMNEHQHVWEANLYGLCHDHPCNEYKAVMSLHSTHVFYVISLKDGSQRMKSIRSELQNFFPRGVGTTVKGLAYWACNTGSKASLIVFDPQEEEFEVIRVPDEWGSKFIRHLGTLDGELAVCVTAVVDCSGVGEFEVWGMKKDGDGDEDSWSKLFVAVDRLYSLSVIRRMDDDEVLVDVNRGELMVYSVGKQTLRPLPRRVRISMYNIVAYFPSLVSPNHNQSLFGLWKMVERKLSEIFLQRDFVGTIL